MGPAGVGKPVSTGSTTTAPCGVSSGAVSMKLAADGAAEVRGLVIPAVLERSLPGDEVIIASIRPSVWFLFMVRLDVAAGILGVCGLGLLMAELEWLRIRPVACGLSAGVGLAALLGVNCVDWLCRAYVLTDRRVVRVSGILRRVVYEAPLNRVQSVTLHKGIRERLCGCGTIVVSSAADSSAGRSLSWYFIDRPEQSSALLRETIRKYSGGGNGDGAGVGGGA